MSCHEVHANLSDGCCICLNNMGRRRTLVLHCGHMVCVECWQRWTEVKEASSSNTTCPLCRATLTGSQESVFSVCLFGRDGEKLKRFHSALIGAHRKHVKIVSHNSTLVQPDELVGTITAKNYVTTEPKQKLLFMIVFDTLWLDDFVKACDILSEDGMLSLTHISVHTEAGNSAECCLVTLEPPTDTLIKEFIDKVFPNDLEFGADYTRIGAISKPPRLAADTYKNSAISSLTDVAVCDDDLSVLVRWLVKLLSQFANRAEILGLVVGSGVTPTEILFLPGRADWSGPLGRRVIGRHRLVAMTDRPSSCHFWHEGTWVSGPALHKIILHGIKSNPKSISEPLVRIRWDVIVNEGIYDEIIVDDGMWDTMVEEGTILPGTWGKEEVFRRGDTGELIYELSCRYLPKPDTKPNAKKRSRSDDDPDAKKPKPENAGIVREDPDTKEPTTEGPEEDILTADPNKW